MRAERRGRTRRPVRSAWVLWCSLVAVVTAGCGGPADRDASGGLTAARVDGIEISWASVDVAGPASDEVRRQALEAAIAEQVLANAAARDQAELGASVRAEPESARRKILARAYITKKAVALPKPTEGEISTFYDDHPELFSRRRIYRLQEITVTVPQARVAEVTTRFRDLKTFGERARWLTEMSIPFTTGVAVKAAEDLPADLLSTLAQLKVGSAFNLPSENGVTTMQITGIEEQPLTLAQAQVYIARFIANQRLGEWINEETRRLREQAKIEYCGTGGTCTN